MGQLIIRFVVGGAIVSAFALLGDLLHPKGFAGLFGAAPSVALATLTLTVASEGPVYAALEARSMIIGEVALVAYAAACTTPSACGTRDRRPRPCCCLRSGEWLRRRSTGCFSGNAHPSQFRSIETDGMAGVPLALPSGRSHHCGNRLAGESIWPCFGRPFSRLSRHLSGERDAPRKARASEEARGGNRIHASRTAGGRSRCSRRHHGRWVGWHLGRSCGSFCRTRV